MLPDGNGTSVTLAFIIGMVILCSSSLSGVAYLQFISARVDSTQMGAVQGALPGIRVDGLYPWQQPFHGAVSWGALRDPVGMLLDWSRGHGCGCGLVLILFRSAVRVRNIQHHQPSKSDEGK